MSTNIHKTKTKRVGRPRKAGGQDINVSLRLAPKLFAKVKDFARATGQTRSRAMQDLIEAGLKAKSK